MSNPWRVRCKKPATLRSPMPSTSTWKGNFSYTTAKSSNKSNRRAHPFYHAMGPSNEDADLRHSFDGSGGRQPHISQHSGRIGPSAQRLGNGVVCFPPEPV